MSLRPPAAITLAGVTLIGAGGLAFAAVSSVSTQPKPQVVIPAAATTPGSDDPAGHDANDDNSARPAGDNDGRSGRDDGANHEHGDDTGGSGAGSGSRDDGGGRGNDGGGDR